MKNYLWEGNLTRNTFDVLFDWDGMSEDWYNSIGGFNLLVSWYVIYTRFNCNVSWRRKVIREFQISSKYYLLYTLERLIKWTVVNLKKKWCIITYRKYTERQLNAYIWNPTIPDMHQGSLSFVRLVSTLWFLAANIFPATFLEGRIICAVSRVHVNWPGLAKRFIARNKLFPVIVSYYKTLVPLFLFPLYWERGSNVRLFIYGFYLFYLFYFFFNPIYMKSCIYNLSLH